MLHSVNQFNGFYLVATDGQLGTVDDVYFDDERWVIRHLVIDTGKWLSGRQVLISPYAVRRIDWNDKSIHVDLSKQQVENSPGVDNHKPVSRQHEAALHDYYGFPYYWSGPLAWGAGAVPGLAGAAIPPATPIGSTEAREDQQQAEEMAQADPHLRSSNEVTGYAIRATDGELGHVADFLFSEDDWAMQLIEIDPRNWLPGKHVVVPIERIREVSWEARQVMVDMTRDEIADSTDADLSATQARDILQHGSAPPRA